MIMKKEVSKCATVKYISESTELFTQGNIYKAFFVEYWQGKRDSLHVKANDGIIHDFIPFEDFEVIEDKDNVLNMFEAEVKCKTHSFDDELFDITFGKTYKAIGCDVDGMFLVMDESMDCYFYNPNYFDIISDPHGILTHQSVYYSFYGCENNSARMDNAHTYSNNHKPELEKDEICGCFYCCEIFSPSEITEWLIHNNPCDKRGTAICPHCGIDSVIGESSGYPITKSFLNAMRKYWFNVDRA